MLLTVWNAVNLISDKCKKYRVKLIEEKETEQNKIHLTVHLVFFSFGSFGF